MGAVQITIKDPIDDDPIRNIMLHFKIKIRESYFQNHNYEITMFNFKIEIRNDDDVYSN